MPASERRPALRAIGGNLVAGLAFTAVAYLGFQLVACHTDPATAHRLDTAVDRAIPFWPWSVFLYSSEQKVGPSRAKTRSPVARREEKAWLGHAADEQRSQRRPGPARRRETS